MNNLTVVIIVIIIILAVVVCSQMLPWKFPRTLRDSPPGSTLLISPLLPPGSAGRAGPDDTSRLAFVAEAGPLSSDEEFTLETSKEGHGGWSQHLDASPNLEWYGWHERFRKENHGGWSQHLDASPNLEWFGPDGQFSAAQHKDHFGGPSGAKEHYGEPPGMIRAVHQDELGFRGWADMPGDYEGSSAAALSGYVQRSA